MTLFAVGGKIIYGGDFLKSKIINIDRAFIAKSIILCLFLIYIFLLIDFTLINDSFGRKISFVFSADKSRVREYFSQKINIVPFATVKLFLKAYKNDSLNTQVIIENIFGNLIAFMPFAFFVPNIFKRVDKFFKFLIFITLCVLLIEILQIVFLTGSADVDDLILNVGGAVAAYGILNIKFVKRFVNKILFGETNEN